MGREGGGKDARVGGGGGKSVEENDGFTTFHVDTTLPYLLLLLSNSAPKN